MITIRTSSLPYSYERIEYIESNGSSYIDTGIYGSNTLDVEISLFTGPDKSPTFFIGSRNNPYNMTYCIVRVPPLEMRFDYSTIHTLGVVTGKVTIKKLGLYVYVGNKQALELPVLKFKTPSTLLMFGLLQKDNVVNIAPAGDKIYFLKMTENGILVRDFIPVKRKSDGMIGMYDLVGRKFYTSPNGVAFTGG